MRRLFLALILILTLAFPAWSATYYMRTDGTAVNKASAAGPANDASKCMSIATHNGQTFSAGDIIILSDKGGVFRGSLIPPSSGSSGSPITYNADGSPSINGSTLVTGWSAATQNVYRASLTGSAGPYWPIPLKVWFNGTLGTQVTSVAAVNGANKWYWGSNTLYVYSTSDPTTAFTNPGIEAAAGNAIYNNNKNYVTIDGVNVTKGNRGIFVEATASMSDVEIRNVAAYNCGGTGIEIGGVYPKTDFILEHNTCNGNGGSGIYLGMIKNAIIQYNVCYSNGATQSYAGGIRLYYDNVDAGGNIVQYNSCYSNILSGSFGGDGIHWDTSGDDEIIRYNLCHDNAQAGIHEECNRSSDDAHGPLLYYNITYSNGKQGIWIQRRDDANSTNKAARVYNNVAYGNQYGIQVNGDAITSCSNNLVINNISIGNSVNQFRAYNGGDNNITNGYGNVYLYNCFGPETSNFIVWGWQTYKSTYAAWETAYGGTTHSVQADPIFVSTSIPDFHLQSTSPCINAGTNVGLTKDFGNNLVKSPPDMGAWQFQTVTSGTGTSTGTTSSSTGPSTGSTSTGATSTGTTSSSGSTSSSGTTSSGTGTSTGTTLTGTTSASTSTGTTSVTGTSSGGTYTLSASNSTFSALGGLGIIRVTGTGVSSWTPTSSVSWITIVSPQVLIYGNSRVIYNVQPNTTKTARKGTITVAGQTVKINQNAIKMMSSHDIRGQQRT